MTEQRQPTPPLYNAKEPDNNEKHFYATESETVTSSNFVSAFSNNLFNKFKEEHLIIPNKRTNYKVREAPEDCHFQPCIVRAGIDIATIASAEDTEKKNLYF